MCFKSVCQTTRWYAMSISCQNIGQYSFYFAQDIDANVGTHNLTDEIILKTLLNYFLNVAE